MLLKGLLLHQHPQVWVLQISCAIATNEWLRDIKRRDDARQFFSMHFLPHIYAVCSSTHLFTILFAWQVTAVWNIFTLGD